MFKRIGELLYCMTPAAIKKDTELILEKISELKTYSSTEDIQELRAKIAREKNLRNSVLDNLDDMVWAKDMSGKYLMTNNAFRERFCYGLSDSEILGKTDIELAQIFKAKVGDSNHTFGEKCKNSDAVIHEVEEAMQFLEKGNINGKVMKLVVNKSPLRDYKGNMFGTCGAGRDVTEWHTSLERVLENSNSCFGEDTRELILKELNKLEFE